MNIKTTKNEFIELAKGLSIPEPKALLFYSSLVTQVDNKVKKLRKPKLKAVLNPRSKYYDNKPGWTKQLSLLIYKHQHSYKRLKHKRITSSNRQWVLLVQIQQAITDYFNCNSSAQFMKYADRFILEAEALSKKFGKNNLYLTFTVANIQEILDISNGYLNDVITNKEQKIWKVYWKLRSNITGKDRNKNLNPGSDEHFIVKEILKIIKEHKTSTNVFMRIQFAAFEFVNSFPRLKNLITENAIDRLQQGIIKRKEEVIDKEDEAYWEDVKNKTSKR